MKFSAPIRASNFGKSAQKVLSSANMMTDWAGGGFAELLFSMSDSFRASSEINRSFRNNQLQSPVHETFHWEYIILAWDRRVIGGSLLAVLWGHFIGRLFIASSRLSSREVTVTRPESGIMY